MVIQAVSFKANENQNKNYVPVASGAAVVTTLGGAWGGYQFGVRESLDSFINSSLNSQKKTAENVIKSTRGKILETVLPLTAEQKSILDNKINEVGALAKKRADLTTAEAAYNSLLEKASGGNLQNAYGKEGYRLKNGMTEEMLKEAAQNKDKAYAEYLKNHDDALRTEINKVPAMRKEIARMRHANRVEGYQEIIAGHKENHENAKSLLKKIKNFYNTDEAVRKENPIFRELSETYQSAKGKKAIVFGIIGLIVGAVAIGASIFAGKAAKTK